MLCGVAMSLRRLSWSGLALVLPLVAACDPVDSGPPPMQPANQYVPPPPPPGDGAGAGTDPNAAGNPNGMYASGEYTLGEDADAYDDGDPSALSDFRQTLDSHGTWSDDPTYGTVWLPAASDVGPDFTPYATGGHWVYDTDYTWVSDYDWGWAPFHYGRWVMIDGRGWGWIPGREYRGAWVSWGVDDGYGYVGWYPMAPAFLWFGGVGVPYTFAIGPRWNYCGRGDVFSPGLGTHLVRGAAATGIAGRVHALPSVNGMASHGPEPSKLGFAAAQVPHATGASALGLAKAQSFSRASTATALGAHPPSHTTATSMTPGGSRPSLTGGSAPSGWSGSHTMTPSTAAQSHAVPTTQVPQKKKTQSDPAPASHPRSGGHSGGGHHR
jgi:hypothetical protein